MQRLILRAVLCLFVYNTSVWMLGKVVSGLAYLLSIAGSPELWTVLHQHPFGRAILLGLLAGLIPLDVWLSVSGFFSANIPGFLKKLDLERMKVWIAAIYSPIAVMAVGGWLVDWFAMRSKRMTLLAESSSMPVSRIFETFFSTNCRNVSDVRLDLWSDNFFIHCAIHVQLISIFLTAVGYSFAPVIKAHFQSTQMTEHDQPFTDSSDQIDSESKMVESKEKQ